MISYEEKRSLELFFATPFSGKKVQVNIAGSDCPKHYTLLIFRK